METRIGILTVSDTRTEADDLSGKVAEDRLRQLGFTSFLRQIVRDEESEIEPALLDLCDTCQAVFTTGGTGFSERDVTPEATAKILDKRADNLSELLRRTGAEKTPYAYLSRGISGVRGKTLVMNLPGSPTAVAESLEAIGPLLVPILEALSGEPCSAHTD